MRVGTKTSLPYPIILGALSLILSGVGCDDSNDDDDGAEEPPAFTATSNRLLDSQGRQVILRGINARVEGIFDVEFDDGRTAVEPIPPFDGDDCRFLAREVGLNHLRLPINWSGVEPQRGEYDEAYLDRVVQLAADCGEEGILTLVDLHQDAWSKHIGEDGAPLWAIVPPPTELLEGPLHDLTQRRISAQVNQAQFSFFDNAEGLQDAYAAMSAHLVERLKGTPGVIGFEIMNEPVNLRDDKLLFDFYRKVVDAVRAVDPEITVFFEPNSLRNRALGFPVDNVLGDSDLVYAPHTYPNFIGGELADIRVDVEAAVEEALLHGVPLYIGEFGSMSAEWLDEFYRQQDLALASSALWVYEEYSQGSWGFWDWEEDENGEPTRGALRGDHVAHIARAYPQAIDGEIVGFSFDQEASRLAVEIAGAGEGDHWLAAPERLYPNGVIVRCDGEEVPTVAGPGRVAVGCRGNRLMMEPR